MKVVFVSTGLDTGGAEMVLLRLLPAMRSRGIEPMVLSLRSPGAIGPKLQKAGINVAVLGLPGLAASVRAWTRMISSMRDFAPDLLHGWMYHGNLAALAAGERLALPVVWGIRQSLGFGTRDKWLTRRMIDAGAWLSARAGLIVYNSSASRSQHESKGFAAAIGRVIPNGFDLGTSLPDESLRSTVRAELGIQPNAFVVAHVARYHPSKDHATFLRAAAQVTAAVPNTRFLMVGEGVVDSNKALMRLVHDLNLRDQVCMLGRRDDVSRLVSAADVAALTSRGEAFPNAIGEAMSCGVPCVGTSVGDMAELIGDTGAIVPPGDPQAVAAAVGRLLALEPEKRRELGARARQRISDRFSIGEVASRYAELLHLVAEQRH